MFSSMLVCELALIILLIFVPGSSSSRIVTLGSIEIFTTHEFFGGKPTVYFQCQGENSTVLPDVKEKNLLYSFKGEESWQPLTELPDKKCKRCGIYEDNSWRPDDVFDEWELCPDEFVEGSYFHFKENEFNASFTFRDCIATNGSAQHDGNPRSESRAKATTNVAVVVTVSVLCSLLTALAAVAAYKYWQKRKREQDHARFLKLFDESDDFEDELGLGPI